MLIACLRNGIAVITAELVGCRDPDFLEHSLVGVLDKLGRYAEGAGNFIKALALFKVPFCDHDLQEISLD